MRRDCCAWHFHCRIHCCCCVLYGTQYSVVCAIVYCIVYESIWGNITKCITFGWLGKQLFLILISCANLCVVWLFSLGRIGQTFWENNCLFCHIYYFLMSYCINIFLHFLSSLSSLYCVSILALYSHISPRSHLSSLSMIALYSPLSLFIASLPFLNKRSIIPFFQKKKNPQLCSQNPKTKWKWLLFFFICLGICRFIVIDHTNINEIWSKCYNNNKFIWQNYSNNNNNNILEIVAFVKNAEKSMHFCAKRPLAAVTTTGKFRTTRKIAWICNITYTRTVFDDVQQKINKYAT